MGESSENNSTRRGFLGSAFLLTLAGLGTLFLSKHENDVKKKEEEIAKKNTEMFEQPFLESMFNLDKHTMGNIKNIIKRCRLREIPIKIPVESSNDFTSTLYDFDLSNTQLKVGKIITASDADGKKVLFQLYVVIDVTGEIFHIHEITIVAHNSQYGSFSGIKVDRNRSTDRIYSEEDRDEKNNITFESLKVSCNERGITVFKDDKQIPVIPTEAEKQNSIISYVTGSVKTAINNFSDILDANSYQKK